MTNLPKIDASVLDGTVGKDDGAQKPRSDPVEAPGGPDWKSLRKATPLNRLLESTVRWAAGLPADVQPRALMAAFPRLANMAAASWDQPSAFQEYLDVLIIDHRGGRQGFPPEIRAELEQLRMYRLYGRYKPKSGVSIYREGRAGEEPPG